MRKAQEAGKMCEARDRSKGGTWSAVDRASIPSGRVLFVLMLLMLAVVGPARAQAPGRVAGTVVSARENRPVAGVPVIIAGTLFAAVTGPDGTFVLDAVPPGSYTVQVNVVDFQPLETKVRVEAGRETKVKLRLKPPEIPLEEVESSGMWNMVGTTGLDARRIRELDPADAGEVVRRVPGGSAGRLGGIGFVPDMRGLSGQRVRVFVDGVPQDEDPLHVVPPLSRLAPAFLDEMRVVPGPYALTMGAGAASAVFVQTRGNEVSSGLVNGYVQSGYSTNLRAWSSAGSVSGARGPVSYRVSGAFRTGAGYEDGSDRPVPAGYDAGDVRGRLAYRWSVSSRIAVDGVFARRRFDELPGLGLTDGETTTRRASVHYQKARSAGLVRFIDLLAYAGDHRDAFDADAEGASTSADSGARASADSGARASSGGGRLAVQVAPLGSLRLDLGTDVDWVQTRAAARLDAESVVAGMFVRGAQAFDSVRVEAALRVDLVHAQASARPQLLQVLDVQGGALDANDTSISGAVAASVPLSLHWRLRAGAASVARSAAVMERYAPGLPLGGIFRAYAVGTPDLKPERVTQGDIGLGADFDRLRVDMRAFGRRIDAYIALSSPHVVPEEPVALGYRARYRNGIAEFWGGEVAVSYAWLGDAVHVYGSAQYLRGRDRESGEELLGPRPLRAHLGLRMDGPADLFFAEAMMHAAGTRNRLAETWGEPDAPAYATVDLRFGVSLGAASALFGVDNLTDAAFAYASNPVLPETSKRLVEPGRVLFATFRYAF